MYQLISFRKVMHTETYTGQIQSINYQLICQEVKMQGLCFVSEPYRIHLKLDSNGPKVRLQKEFNMFYSRFVVHDFSNKTPVLKHNLLNSSESVSSLSVRSVAMAPITLVDMCCTAVLIKQALFLIIIFNVILSAKVPQL